VIGAGVYRTMPYRLTLDVPYRFVVRPAFERATHCVDLAAESVQNLYHDTGAGVLILTPSTLDHRWRENTVPTDSINKQAAYWREVYRSAREASETPARFMGSVLRANQDRTLMEWYISIAIEAIRAGHLLRWVAETQFQLQRDEGWAVHIQCADDEYTREGDYWYAQWDRYALRMDTAGNLAFFRYPDRDNLQQPPKLVAQWYSGVSSPVRSAVSVAAIPLPPLGVLVLTVVSGGARLMQASTSSTTRQIASSKLVPLPDDAENIGTTESPVYSLCRPSPLRLAVNIMYNPIVAIERVRYPESGTLIEKPFDVPPINPQVPQAVPIVALTHKQSASVSFERESGGSWVAWNDAQSPLQARGIMQLTTDNPIYTPVVVGYFMRCEPFVAERDTTPVLAERVLELELTKDEYAREEGYADCLLESDATRRIAQRGDTTYRLEYRMRDGDPWQTLSEGFATVESITPMRIRPDRFPCRVRFALKGMWGRFSEIFQLASTAFDGVALSDAFNKLLEGCGFERIASPPDALQSLRMPAAPAGDTSGGWRYAPRVGQSSEEILRTLLLFATATGSEWRLRWDYNAGAWTLEQKPDGLPAWTLLDAGSVDPALRQYRYSELEIVPRPPEANIIYVEGATAPSKEGERLVVVLVNEDSLTEPESLDYLGRYKLLRVQADTLSDLDAVQRLADRLYDAAARHAIEAQVRLPLPPVYDTALLELLSPPRRVQVLEAGTVLLDGWVKRATLTASGGSQPRAELQLHISTRYAGDPRD
jgi:hypothetical protein